MTRDPLLDALDAPSAEAWVPEKAGDVIVGRVIGTSHYDAGYGDYPIFTVKVEQATVGGKKSTNDLFAVHCLGMVLPDLMEAKGVRVGGRVAVRFDGEKESKKGNTYKAWSVAFEPPKPGDDLVAALEDEEPF